MVKYIYSSKAKKVLAIESGSDLEKKAIERGLTLFDSYDEAAGAVQQASAPVSEPEGYVIDKTGKVKRIAGELYNKAVAKGTVIYDDLAKAQAGAATIPSSSSSSSSSSAPSSSSTPSSSSSSGTPSSSSVKKPVKGLREEAMAYLDRLYEGDLARDIARIDAGERMAEGTTDAQKRFITMARAVNAAKTDDEVQEAMASVPEIAARRELDFKQKNWHSGGAKGPPGKAILAPNLTYRTQRGSGAVSKGVGLAEDLFGLIPRALRAGAEELTSSADDMTFVERMAVPHELLSGPQAFFTEGLSSIAPGVATEKTGLALGNAVAKVVPYANKARAFLRGKQGQAVESVTDAVRKLDLPEKISRGTYAGRQTLKGLGEGAAYSAHPTALELTSPDEGSTSRAILTGALGLGSGAAARAGMGALTYGSKVRSLSPEILTPSGREMRYGSGPMERIGAAVSADEMILDKNGVPKALSRGSESQLAPLDQAVKDISSARTELEDRAANVFLKYGDRLPEGFVDQQLTPEMAHRLSYDIKKYGLPEELLDVAKRPAGEYIAKVKPGELPEEAFAFPGVADQYPKAEDLNPRIFPEPEVSLEYPAPLTEMKFPEPIVGEGALLPEQVKTQQVYAEGPLPEVPVTSWVDPEFSIFLDGRGLGGVSLGEEELRRAKTDYIRYLFKEINDEAREQALRDLDASEVANALWEKYYPGKSVLNYLPPAVGKSPLSEGEYTRKILDLVHDGWISGRKIGDNNPFIGTPREEEYLEALKLSDALAKRSVEGQRQIAVAQNHTEPAARQQALDWYGLGTYNPDHYVTAKRPFADLLGLQPVEGEEGLAEALRHTKWPGVSVERHGEPIIESAPVYGPGAPVLLDPPRMMEAEGPPQLLEFPVAGPPKQVYVPVEGPPMIPFDQKVEYWAPSRKSAAEGVAGRGFNQENAEDYLKAAQALSHWGEKFDRPPSDEFSTVRDMLKQLPAPGKEEDYLRKIGRSRLERSTNILPFRNALDLQSRVNKELGKEYAWDIPSVVAAYRQRLTPGKASLGMNDIDMSAVLPFSAMATMSVGKKAARLAKEGAHGGATHAPAAGARQETRYGEASGNVPVLKIIGKGGIVEAPYTPVERWDSVKHME